MLLSHRLPRLHPLPEPTRLKPRLTGPSLGRPDPEPHHPPAAVPPAPPKRPNRPPQASSRAHGYPTALPPPSAVEPRSRAPLLLPRSLLPPPADTLAAPPLLSADQSLPFHLLAGDLYNRFPIFPKSGKTTRLPSPPPSPSYSGFPIPPTDRPTTVPASPIDCPLPSLCPPSLAATHRTTLSRPPAFPPCARWPIPPPVPTVQPSRAACAMPLPLLHRAAACPSCAISCCAASLLLL